MTTHELADALNVLASLLKSSPRVDVSVWAAAAAREPSMDQASVAMSLTTLLSLSRLTKNQWRELIDEWDLPIEIKPSMSSRDLMGRLLNYLEDHPEAVKKLQQSATKKSKKPSSKLLDALGVLLGGESNSSQ
jgi:hypothetical protein